MGFLQRARLVLKGDIGPRVVVAPPAATEEPLTHEQLAALEEIAQRMAAMAASIKDLEARAHAIHATRDADAAEAGAATAAEAANAQVQVEIIDELLIGVRQLRTALDQQRDELVDAERRFTGSESEAPRGGDKPAG
jgi:uncharacterized small protein (DUF1192 family)